MLGGEAHIGVADGAGPLTGVAALGQASPSRAAAKRSSAAARTVARISSLSWEIAVRRHRADASTPAAICRMVTLSGPRSTNSPRPPRRRARGRRRSPGRFSGFLGNGALHGLQAQGRAAKAYSVNQTPAHRHARAPRIPRHADTARGTAKASRCSRATNRSTSARASRTDASSRSPPSSWCSMAISWKCSMPISSRAVRHRWLPDGSYAPAGHRRPGRIRPGTTGSPHGAAGRSAAGPPGAPHRPDQADGALHAQSIWSIQALNAAG